MPLSYEPSWAVDPRQDQELQSCAHRARQEESRELWVKVVWVSVEMAAFRPPLVLAWMIIFRLGPT